MSTRRQSYLAGFTVLAAILFMAVIYKIPFSTDDFRYMLIWNEGHANLLDAYFFRLPVWRVLHYLLFPLYTKLPWLVKYLAWSAGIVGLIFPLDWFLRKYCLKPALSPFIAGLVLFAPNQYEITFLIYCLPYCFGFLLAGLGFTAMRKQNWFIGTSLYILSFLTLESFLVWAVLLELTADLENLAFRKPFLRRHVIMALVLLFYFGLRIGLHVLNPYPYGIYSRLYLSQIRGFFYDCFLIDFYKLNGVLSFLQLLLYAGLFLLWTKNAKKDDLSFYLKRVLILLAVLFFTSSYYFFLNYSARRALAGQISFTWGFYLVIVLDCVLKLRTSAFVKTGVFILFIFPQLGNQILIGQTKWHNYDIMNEKILQARQVLADENQILKIKLGQIRAEMKRDWIFADTQDVELFYRVQLSPEQYRRIIFVE